jgi:hypothetical protein
VATRNTSRQLLDRDYPTALTHAPRSLMSRGT